jgi:Tfp pilus assembly protein PilO
MERKRLNTEEYIKLVRESPEKKRGYIFAGATIVVSILLIIFAVKPTLSTITQINSSIKEKNRLNIALDSKISTLSALDKQFEEVGTDLKNLKLIYPAEGNFSLLLANIHPILSRNGFYLNGINFDKYGDKNVSFTAKVLVPWTVKISTKGKITNVINLLKELEALPMYPVVESFAYTDQKDENGLTNFSINMRIYKIDNANFYE